MISQLIPHLGAHLAIACQSVGPVRFPPNPLCFSRNARLPPWRIESGCTSLPITSVEAFNYRVHAAPLSHHYDTGLIRQGMDRQQAQARRNRQVVLPLVVVGNCAPVTCDVTEHDADDGNAVFAQCRKGGRRSDEQPARMKQRLEAWGVPHVHSQKNRASRFPQNWPDACYEMKRSWRKTPDRERRVGGLTSDRCPISALRPRQIGQAPYPSARAMPIESLRHPAWMPCVRTSSRLRFCSQASAPATLIAMTSDDPIHARQRRARGPWRSRCPAALKQDGGIRRAQNVMRLEFPSEEIAPSEQGAIREHREALAADSKIQAIDFKGYRSPITLKRPNM